MRLSSYLTSLICLNRAIGASIALPTTESKALREDASFCEEAMIPKYREVVEMKSVYCGKSIIYCSSKVLNKIDEALNTALGIPVFPRKSKSDREAAMQEAYTTVLDFQATAHARACKTLEGNCIFHFNYHELKFGGDPKLAFAFIRSVSMFESLTKNVKIEYPTKSDICSYLQQAVHYLFAVDDKKYTDDDRSSYKKLALSLLTQAETLIKESR